MARLKQTKDGWQWDDGLVFPERWLAVDWGRAIIHLEQLKELHELIGRREASVLRIKQLKELQNGKT